MLNKSEKQIIFFIKFAPLFLILFLFIVIISALFVNSKRDYENSIQVIKTNFINSNKELIKSEVNRVHDYIMYEKNNSEDELKKSIKSKVYESYSIANSLYNKYKNEKTKSEILQLIKAALQDVRFNDGRGYIFIDDINGNKILQPLSPELEGKNLLEFSDSKGYKFVKTIAQTIKDKSERFDTYYWYKKGDRTKSYKKISFYKAFEPLDVAIGAGEYIDDYEQALKQKLLKYIEKIRFGKNGYVFIIDYDGNYLSHIVKKYIGLNRIDLKDKNGVFITKEIIKKAKSGGDYLSYIGTFQPITKKPGSKISYARSLDDWNWAIASGFYEDEVYKFINNRKKELEINRNSDFLKLIEIAIVLTILLMMISVYFSKVLANKFIEYKEAIFEEIEKNKQKDIILSQQSKMASMGEMLGNIAHQWRQPLSVITSASSGMKLQKEMGFLTDENFYTFVDGITNTSQHLSKTIDDFRNFFCPNKEKKEFDIADSIEKTLKLVEAQFINKNIEIIKNIENIQILGFENELLQVLINILNNAKDELLLKNNDDKKLLFINVKSIDEKIEIVIRDNGRGISDDIKDKIFEPYFTTKHQYQGTGIGLYMSEEIVVKHLQGEIYAQNCNYVYNNCEYSGAEFKIILPKINNAPETPNI